MKGEERESNGVGVLCFDNCVFFFLGGGLTLHFCVLLFGTFWQLGKRNSVRFGNLAKHLPTCFTQASWQVFY